MKKITVICLLCISVLYFLVCAVRHNLAMDAVMSLLSPSQKTIILDAGHGGEDGGAITSDGVAESHLNLQIALRLEQLLAFAGLETKLIRDEDISVYSDGCVTLSEKKVSDLKNRVKTISSISNGLLVSIHQNHFTDGKYYGAQVFYAKTDGSKELAIQMQNHVETYLDNTNHRKAKQADAVYLLNNVTCPAVLVECGFLSNNREAQLLQSDEYQKKLACTLCGALNVYLEGSINDEV